MDDAQAAPEPLGRGEPKTADGGARTPAGDSPGALPYTKVTVACGHLAFARYPVLVGHYRGDTFAGTEAMLDRVLEKRLTRAPEYEPLSRPDRYEHRRPRFKRKASGRRRRRSRRGRGPRGRPTPPNLAPRRSRLRCDLARPDPIEKGRSAKRIHCSS